MTNKGQKPAFPAYEHIGLTKREWFAGMVIQGLLGGSAVDMQFADLAGNVLDCRPLLASDAVKMADAMIAELNK